MSLKIAGLVTGIILVAGTLGFLFISRQEKTPQTSISKPTTGTKKLPSSAPKEYADPSGFSFSYPDDLSLTKNEATDSATYADLKINSKEIDGSLNLKIQDTKLTSVEEWLKERDKVSIEDNQIKWGSLNGQSLEDKNGIIFAAVDKGILFTMEVFYGDQREFWQKVYDEILSSFSFNSQVQETNQTGGSSAEDVVLEGEELLE